MPGPHDLLARRMLNHPECAKAQLRAMLPPAVAAQVAWETLQYEEGSVVDEELRETEADILFSVRTHGGRPLLFYLLLEHQSEVDWWMALRMLRYVIRQLEQWRKHHNPGKGELLPVIIPQVLYHGTDGPWDAPRRIEDLFDIPDQPEWRALVPRFEFRLDDLTVQSTEALAARAGPAFYRLVLLFLRCSRSEELVQRLVEWTPLFAALLATPEGLERLHTLVKYLIRVGTKGAREATMDMLDSVVDSRSAEELMRTWGEELIEEGMAKGLAKGQAEGLAKGRAEYVLRTLTVRGIHVDAQARQRILSCMDLATLDRWFDRALGATTLDDVLGACA